MSNDNLNLELTGSLARKRLLPSVSEVVKGLSSKVSADPALIFRTARQVVADELGRVKQGFEAASADVLVERARLILSGEPAAPAPPVPELPRITTTQPLPFVAAAGDPFAETTGALDLKWDREPKDILTETPKPVEPEPVPFEEPLASPFEAQASPFETQASPFEAQAALPEFTFEPAPPPQPVSEDAVPFDAAPTLAEPVPLWQTQEPPLEEKKDIWEGLEKEAASVSLTDVLPPTPKPEPVPEPLPWDQIPAPAPKAQLFPEPEPFTPLGTEPEPEPPTVADFPVTPPVRSAAAAELPPGWLEKDPTLPEEAETKRIHVTPEPGPPPSFIENVPVQEPSRFPRLAAALAVVLIAAAAVYWFVLRPSPKPEAPQAPAPAVHASEATPAPAAVEAPVEPSPAEPAPGQAAAPKTPEPVVVPPTAVPTEVPTPVPPPPTPVRVVAKPEKPAPAQPVSATPASPSTEPAVPVKQTRAGTIFTKDWVGKASVFVVHFSSYQEKARAEKDAQRIGKKLGQPMNVIEVDLKEKGIWYRVVAGEFSTAQEALAYRQELEAQNTPNLGLVYKLAGRDN